MSSPRVALENGSFLTYEGIGVNGHWNPGGASVEDARTLVYEFGDMPSTTGTSLDAHRGIMEFDRRTRRQHGDMAYNSTGFYPQFAWLALDRSGIMTALADLTTDETKIKINGFLGHAGLLIPRQDFEVAAELVAQGQPIDWEHRDEGCGGNNLLYLYAGNIVSKVYPDRGFRSTDVLVESFVFDPAKT